MRRVFLGSGVSCFAGLASGIAFRNSGWDVKVMERASRVEPVGAALSLWSNACAAMANLGVLPEVEAASAPIRALFLASRSGTPLLSKPVAQPALMCMRLSHFPAIEVDYSMACCWSVAF